MGSKCIHMKDHLNLIWSEPKQPERLKAPGKVTRWVIDNTCYLSSCKAAEHLNLYENLIRYWCSGQKQGCYTITMDKPLCATETQVLRAFRGKQPKYLKELQLQLSHINKHTITRTVKSLRNKKKLKRINNDPPYKYIKVSP